MEETLEQTIAMGKRSGKREEIDSRNVLVAIERSIDVQENDFLVLQSKETDYGLESGYTTLVTQTIACA